MLFCSEEITDQVWPSGFQSKQQFTLWSRNLWPSTSTQMSLTSSDAATVLKQQQHKKTHHHAPPQNHEKI
jgi:hypothetical protein